MEASSSSESPRWWDLSAEQEDSFKARLAKCKTASKMARLVDEKFLSQCSYENLRYLRHRIQVLPVGFYKKRVVKAIDCLDIEIREADKGRRALIEKHVKKWAGLKRAEMFDLVDALVEELTRKREDWHCCSESFALEEILRALSKKIEWSDLDQWPCLLVELKTGAFWKEKISPVSDRVRECVDGLSVLELGVVEEECFETLQKQRVYRVRNRKRLKEILLRNEGQKACSKLFPPTSAWLLGEKDQKDGSFEKEIRSLAAKYGIVLVGKSADSDGENFLVLEGKFSSWPQDIGDFSRDEVRIPVAKHKRWGKLNLVHAIQEARKKRNAVWASEANTAPLFRKIGRVHGTWDWNPSRHMVALARALGCPAVMNLTYNEGGNTLLGRTKDGEPCAVIGWDSVEATRAILQHDLDCEVTDEILRDAFQIDYGVEPVFFVEQPGSFHLDMSMAFVADGTIILNDSLAAHQLFAADFLRQSKKEGISSEDAHQALKELEALAHCCAELEEIAAEQLEAFGFKVHRYPGRYFMKRVGVSKVEVMNMFNFLTATVGQNERLLVALGTIESDVPYKEAFLRMLQETGGDPEHVEFLSLELSQMLLKHKGGLSCSIKTIE